VFKAAATSPCPEPVLSNPGPLSHFLKVPFDMILSNKPRTSKWPLAFRYLHKNPLYAFVNIPVLNTRSFRERESTFSVAQ